MTESVSSLRTGDRCHRCGNPYLTRGAMAQRVLFLYGPARPSTSFERDFTFQRSTVPSTAPTAA